jgi:hypothetical protein
MNVPPVDFLLSPGTTPWPLALFCIAGTWFTADLATIALMAARLTSVSLMKDLQV